MRFALGISYLGSSYVGWQSQPGQDTVQGRVEQAAAVVANHDVTLMCAGRTDSGVHAACQVAHLDVYTPRSSQQLCRGINSHLPSDIRVLWAVPVADDFHARFTALSRSYTYIIDRGKQHLPAFLGWTHWCPYLLDLADIQKAMAFFIGEHDFASFQASGCQSAHARREIVDFHVAQSGQLLYLNVTANAFVYRMVRKMVGLLVEIGRGRQHPDRVEYLLHHISPSATPPIAASGLHLSSVAYPEGMIPKVARYFSIS